MGIGELFAGGIISARKDAAKQLQDDAVRSIERSQERAAGQTVAKGGAGLGRDVFKSSASLKALKAQAPAIDPETAIDGAEKQFEPAVLKQVPGVVSAPASGAQTLQNAYGQIAQQATPLVPAAVDGEMAQQTFAQTAQKMPEVNGQYPGLTNYLQGILDRLCKAGGVDPGSVHLFQTQDVNAFNAGGTSMAVLTGILPFMKNEAELAGVLGHELTHGMKRHVIQGAVREDVSQSAGELVAKSNPIDRADAAQLKQLIGKMPAAQQQDPDAVLKALQGQVKPEVLANLQFQENNQLAMLALQRGNESEADAGAARLLSKAGYDPNALVTAFQRLPQAPGDVRFQDHPSNAQRISDLQAQIKNENLAVGPMETNEAAYQQAISVLKPSNTAQA